ncbi:SusC/RagA family TonB-linked outer membrane protein [Sphingobacterium sp. LRF_L2]|uniref:SusC/RagA family TonB-linked outer membrane protein n=1 Tax=Sphingobacterium sp. LRF_L2 TaxID=3369421 RepID=UPI003F609F57
MRFSIATLTVLLVTFSLGFSFDSNAQGVLNRSASIEASHESRASILKELSRQTKVQFIYSELEDIRTPVSVKATRQPLKLILEQMLGKELTYELVGQRVVIRQLPPAIQVRVQGLVTDANGNTLAGVNVGVKGERTATATDENGLYSITATSRDVLVFRMMGYNDTEIAVGTKQTINVTMRERMNELTEVVINTGYQSIDRKKFTGAAATIKAADAQRAGVPDISRMLEGQAAGVSVQNVSGTFGAAPKIRVRGATSITGDNKPLWVIDGVILEDIVNVSNDQLSTGDPSTLLGSSVAGLNPDDIESFQILKDAAATSLYGARAMNGVILITTKKGRSNVPSSISYTGNFTTFLKPSYSQFDIVNSYDQMSVYAEMERKGWLDYANMANNSDGGVYTKMAQGLLFTNNGSGLPVVENSVAGRRAFLERYVYANTDWFDVLFKNSLQQEHSLSLTSGSERSQQYYSTSYLQDDGWSIGNGVRRFTGNVRSDFNINERLSLGLITTGSVRDQQAPGSLGQRSNPVTGEVSRDFDINPFSYALNTTRTLTPYDENGNLEYFTMNYAPFNILHELQNNSIDLRMIDFKVQGEVKYKLPKKVNYTFLGSYRYVSTAQKHRIQESSNMAMAYRAGTVYSGQPENSTIIDGNRFLYTDPTDPDGRPVTVLPYGGFYLTNNDGLKSYYLRNSFDWNKEFGSSHNLRAFLSQELRYLDRTTDAFTGYGYQFARGGVPYVDPNAIKREVEGNLSYYNASVFSDRHLAFAGNAAYSYQGRFQFNGTVRYDGSNQMGESATARWLPTWNLSGSWNVDEEAFMKNQDFFNTLTLRATYGLTASMGAATNSSLVVRSASTPRPYLTEVEPVLNIIYNPNNALTWEKQYETNIGIDASMFNRRIQFSLDLYNRDGFDLIGLIRTAGVGGEALKYANYADMNSKGIELLIKADVIKRDNWGWKTQLTNAINTGKITRLSSEPSIWNLVTSIGGAKQGFPYRGLFSIDFERLNAEQGTPLYVNEDGTTSNNVYLQSLYTDYLKYEGPVDPTFNGGFFNSFNYKNFSASFLVTYSAGNKIRLNPIFKNSYSDMEAMSYDFLNRFVLPNDEGTPSIVEIRNESQLPGDQVYNAYNYSTERVADGGFIRLKQVMLSYQSPQKFVEKLGLKTLSLSIVGNNLWLIYADKKLNGQDPEFYGSGGVAMPLPRQFTLSLKTNL